MIVYTGRMIWLEQPPDSPFETRAAEEVAYARDCHFGQKSGTYFKTARSYKGMPVWVVELDDFDQGLINWRHACVFSACPHGVIETEPCDACTEDFRNLYLLRLLEK